MTQHPTSPNPDPITQVILAADQGLAPLHVELQSFLEFNRTMNQLLAELESQHQADPTASPVDRPIL